MASCFHGSFYLMLRLDCWLSTIRRQLFWLSEHLYSSNKLEKWLTWFTFSASAKLCAPWSPILLVDKLSSFSVYSKKLKWLLQSQVNAVKRLSVYENAQSITIYDIMIFLCWHVRRNFRWITEMTWLNTTGILYTLFNSLAMNYLMVNGLERYISLIKSTVKWRTLVI